MQTDFSTPSLGNIMTPADLLAFLALIGAFSIGALVRHFATPYLAEKGKNLATKEDIEELTHKVEAIKSAYSLLIEEFRKREALRAAALDRRLEAHQVAFAHWWALVGAVHSERVHDEVMKCQEFWVNNSLYLSAEAGHAFRAAYVAASNHMSMVDSFRGQGREANREVELNFKTITSAGDIIRSATELPALNDGYQAVR